jgi:4-hydroxyphenylpyruvate dioxygenase
MRTSIATVSISGTLPEKLKAIAATGYDAVEIFEADFLSYNGSARDVAAMAADLGLTICAYQPFRDFEGMTGAARAQGFHRAEAKFDLMQEMGTDLMLVCSNVSPACVGGIDRAANDFRDLGERAAKRGLRVGYEALAWGRHVSDYRDAWEIVRRADHPSIGLILDSFHLYARGLTVDAIPSIPGDRIFLVQLADAPKLHLDSLSWSRHFRCFPGQGGLPVDEFMRAIAMTGYSGVFSHEIFNDQFRAGPTERIARDGMRSLILMQDRLKADAEIATETPRLPPPSTCLGVEFIEFAVNAEAGNRLGSLFGTMGFVKSGRHISKSVERWTQGGINLVINTDRNGFAHSHHIAHGPGVCAIGLKVTDVAATMQRAEQLLAQSFRQPVGPGELEIPAIRGVGGSLIYFLEPSGELARVWEKEFTPIADTVATGVGLTRIDHLAQSMLYDEMLSWALFYTSIFDVRTAEQLDIADPGGLVQSQAVVSTNGALRFALNGSVASRTLSSRFMAEYFGSGVQHIAFETPDIFAAVEAMRAQGLSFLDIPENYYDDLEAKYDLDPAVVRRLRDNEILYDRVGDTEFYQIYTHAFAERFFFEIVERRGYEGFGAANASIRLAAQAREARPVGMPRLSDED